MAEFFSLMSFSLGSADHTVRAYGGVALGDECSVNAVVIEIPHLEAGNEFVHEIDALDELFCCIGIEAFILGEIVHGDLGVRFAAFHHDGGRKFLLEVLYFDLHVLDLVLLLEDFGDEVLVADTLFALEPLLEEGFLVGGEVLADDAAQVLTTLLDVFLKQGVHLVLLGVDVLLHLGYFLGRRHLGIDFLRLFLARKHEEERQHG